MKQDEISLQTGWKVFKYIFFSLERQMHARVHTHTHLCQKAKMLYVANSRDVFFGPFGLLKGCTTCHQKEEISCLPRPDFKMPEAGTLAIMGVQPPAPPHYRNCSLATGPVISTKGFGETKPRKPPGITTGSCPSVLLDKMPRFFSQGPPSLLSVLHSCNHRSFVSRGS